MRRQMSHLLPIALLVLVVFSAPAVAADSTTSQIANVCARYQAYVMPVEGVQFGNPRECMTYATHGGSLRIGHSDPTIIAGAGGYSVSYALQEGGWAVTGLPPGSTARFATDVTVANRPYAGSVCDVRADNAGNVVLPECLGGSAPQVDDVTPSYTVHLTIVDLSTNVLVAEASASYNGG